ncbi:hypothetical protein [Taibaiella koreensis]|uniref:hypothetical protein n=1 Tax=Taibaiella koreensis TaxID=1268548 RepID=UPI000E59F39C|nr:hypothetical protein [Taibaiella koreensis]
MTKTFLLAAIIYLLQSLSNTGHAAGYDYKGYGKMVNLAELELIEGRYIDALQYYDSAFALKKGSPFLIDLYNASVCAVKAGKNDLAMKLCKEMADLGVGGAAFTATNVYYNLFSHVDWKENVKHADVIRAALLKKNSRVLAFVDTLVVKDQEYNHAWRNSGMAEKQRDIMYLKNDTISRQLNEILRTNNFLDDRTVGPSLDENKTFSYNKPFDVIIVHNYQNRSGDTVFNAVLKDALESGKITPDRYAALLDMGINNGDRPYYGELRFYMQYKCKLYVDNFNKERQQKIDSNRASIGLCSTSDLLKKVIFRTKYPANDFKISAQLSMLGSFADKQSEDMMLKESSVVFDQIPNCREM